MKVYKITTNICVCEDVKSSCVVVGDYVYVRMLILVVLLWVTTCM